MAGISVYQETLSAGVYGRIENTVELGSLHIIVVRIIVVVPAGLWRPFASLSVLYVDHGRAGISSPFGCC